MKRLHLINGIIERPLSYRQKVGDYKEIHKASYIFTKIPDGSITVLKNRFGLHGEITKAEHTTVLHRNHVSHIIPNGRWEILE